MGKKLRKSTIFFLLLISLVGITACNSDLELNRKLGVAVKNDNFEEAKQLLDMGADPNYIYENNIYFNSLLHKAVSNDNEKMVELLLDEGADVHYYNSYGNTALSYKAPVLGVLKLLVKAGADVNSCSEYSSSLPIITNYAIYGNFKELKFAVESGADVNNRCKSIYNRTALMWAAVKNRKEMVKYLLSKGADKKLLNSKNKTAGEMASFEMHSEVANMLAD